MSNFWSTSFKKWIYCLNAKLISLYRVCLFNFTIINRPGVAGAVLQTASPFLQEGTSNFPPKKQRLHKLCFLQKLGCQKPCWDQAKLSRLYLYYDKRRDIR